VIEVTGYAKSVFQDRNTLDLAWFVVVKDKMSLDGDASRWSPMTDHDAPLETLRKGWNGFRPQDGLSVSPTRSDSGLNNGDTEIAGVIRSDGVSSDKLEDRLYRGGQVERYLTSWRYPWLWGLTQRTGVQLDQWDIGRTTYDDTQWAIGCNGLRGRLGRRVGEITARTCQNQLGTVVQGPNGDYRSRCTLDITVAPWTQTTLEVYGTVGYGGREGLFVQHPTNLSNELYQEEDWWKHGFVTVETGPLAGQKFPISDSVFLTATQQLITLQLPMPQELTLSDTVSITTGCDHLTSTCKQKFNRLQDYRGDQQVPGQDAVIQAGNQAV